ncbi:MAG: hypothetical protein TR69_WS6001001002 [candidate division WS6 bacterium OLB20]|uniref:FemAB family protein n=1 Tax=candidate division WS6 bacterium OLB20 TaxID=1617426 RepID=A0A136LZ95_9BACT|nr:MAG: hypothetical protein TR69_WS6001001002 [candidate division WS6 bacterium OLB20]
MDLKITDNLEEYDAAWKLTQGHVLQHSAWGEVKRPGWEPLRFIIRLDDEIIAVLQVLIRQTAGVRIGYSPKASLPLLHFER